MKASRISREIVHWNPVLPLNTPGLIGCIMVHHSYVTTHRQDENGFYGESSCQILGNQIDQHAEDPDQGVENEVTSSTPLPSSPKSVSRLGRKRGSSPRAADHPEKPYSAINEGSITTEKMKWQLSARVVLVNLSPPPSSMDR